MLRIDKSWSEWRRSLEGVVASTPLLDIGRRGALGALGAGFDHVHELHDVAYGPAARQQLDIYYPAGREPRAAVVFVHGGAWRTGHKDEYRFVGRSLASQGYAVAVIGYRLFPEVRFPGFVQDVGEALVFLAGQRARLGWPAGKVWLCGHSAGAHIIALLGLEPAFMAPLGRGPDVAGLLCLSAPFSFDPLKDVSLREVFGTREDKAGWLPMCPLACVGAGNPPLVAIHGDRDRLVSHRGAERMVAAAQQAGQQASLVSFAGQGHFQPLLAFHPRMPGHARLMATLANACEGG